MSTGLPIYRVEKGNQSVTRLTFDLKTKFDKYFLSRMPFIRNLELSIKAGFKDAEEDEEINAFFELEVTSLIDELNFHLVSFDSFSAADNVERVKKFLEQIQRVLYGSLKNNEITLKALDNIQLITSFFESLENRTEDALGRISIVEKDFDMTNTPVKLKTALGSLEEVCLTMMKAIRKMKKTQLTFTIDDQLLSSLIQQMSTNEITLNSVMERFDRANEVLADLQRELEALSKVDLTPKNNDIDMRIKQVSKSFIQFFTDPSNHVNQFLVSCYLYRESLIEDYMGKSSDLANLALNKLRSYQVFAFLKYYDETIEADLDRGLKTLAKNSKRFFEERSLSQDFENSNELASYVRLTLLFIRSFLSGRQVDEKIFDNSYLKERMPKVGAKIDKQTLKIEKISRELELAEVLIPFYDDYAQATAQLKQINLRTTKSEEKLQIQRSIRKFMIETKKLERVIYDYKGSSTAVYQQIYDIVEGNKIIADEYRSLFFLMDK